MANKLKKALLAGIAGATLFGGSGCSWKSAGVIRIDDKGAPIIETIGPLEERYNIGYSLEDLINRGSNLQVVALETKSKSSLYRQLEKIKIDTKAFDVVYNPTTELVNATLVGSLLFGIGLVAGPMVGIVHELDSNGLATSEMCGKLRNEAKEAYESGKITFESSPNAGGWKVRLDLIRHETTSQEKIIKEYEIHEGSEVSRAKNIRLIATPEQLFDNCRANTDERGVGTFRFSNSICLSREPLEQKLKVSVLSSARNVEEKFRDYALSKQEYILNELIKSIRKTDQAFEIRTDVTNGINGSIKGSIGTYIALVGADDIYGGLILERIYSIRKEYENLINRNINSKIREVTIKLKDIDSHTPIDYAKIEIKSNAPQKRRLAQEIVGEDDTYLDFAIKRIDDYIIGEDTKTFDEEGALRFKVYLPSSFDAEIIHKKYNAVQENFKFEEDKLAKTVFMSELGQKMRVKIVDK